MPDLEYITIDPQTLDRRQSYALQTSVLVPRPIAWVATVGPGGVFNCAPFSYFMGVSSHPPVVAFAVGARRTGPKDTVRNLKHHPEFTINIVHEAAAEAMVQTSAEYPPDQSEFAAVQLDPVPSELISAPRIGGAPVQMECRLHHMFEVDDTRATMILGRILRYHIDAGAFDREAGAVDIHKLKPVGRLGGTQYCRVRDVFEIPRPTLKS